MSLADTETTVAQERAREGLYSWYHSWDKHETSLVFRGLGLSDRGIRILVSASVTGRSLPHIEQADLIQATLEAPDCRVVMKLVAETLAVREAQGQHGKGFLCRAEVLNWDTNRVQSFATAWTGREDISRVLVELKITGRSLFCVEKNTVVRALGDGLSAAILIGCLDVFQ